MSISTAVAHFGVLRVRWISMSSGFIRTGNMRAVAEHGVDQRRGNVHLRDRVAEFVGLRLLQFDRPFADDRTMMPAGARGH